MRHGRIFWDKKTLSEPVGDMSAGTNVLALIRLLPSQVFGNKTEKIRGYVRQTEEGWISYDAGGHILKTGFKDSNEAQEEVQWTVGRR